MNVLLLLLNSFANDMLDNKSGAKYNMDLYTTRTLKP
jgi:hypothetical protein